MVLADEPTAALDKKSGENVMAMFHRLADGPERATILIVTHDQRLIDHADRIVNMVGGRIVANVCPKILVKIITALSMVKNLEGLSEATLTRIAECMSIERRPAGETIISEGQPGDRFYLIGEGTAEVFKDHQFQRELTVGERFGEVTSIYNRIITETVRGKTDLELYVITKDDLEHVMSTDASFDLRIRRLVMAQQSK
jgi:putative ABC transport system ATP-binding protein